MKLIDADELEEKLLSLRDDMLYEDSNHFLAVALTKFAKVLHDWPEIDLTKDKK